jgi:hypothetical protein
MQYKTAYKVVQCLSDGRLASVMADVLPPELVVYYEPGDVARPTIGRLMVWADLHPAQRQAGHAAIIYPGRYEVWKVQAEDPQFVTGAIPIENITAQRAQFFWDNIAWWLQHATSSYYWPFSETVWGCLGIMLQECVDVYGED